MYCCKLFFHLFFKKIVTFEKRTHSMWKLLIAVVLIAVLKNSSEARLFKRHALKNSALKSTIVKRNAVSDPKLKWPGGVIPYLIDDSLTDYPESWFAIYEAMAKYRDSTCIRFVFRSDEEDYLSFKRGQGGCYSFVGRQGGEQEVGMGNGCYDLGTVLHLLGNAIGFYNEENRSDRDDYIVINEENVVEGFESQLEKLDVEQNLLLVPFDLDSIMLHGNYFLSKDGTSPTIEAKNGQRLPEVYDKKDLSEGDVENVKSLYDCQ